MTSFQTFWNGLDWSVLTDILLRILPALVCITVHELCHGLTAWRLGDDTARRAGRLTLNPLAHFDPLGTLMMVAVGFGWARPVPVDMRRFRNPRRDMALTALAGPLSNLLLTALTLFLYGLFALPLYRAGTALADFAADTLMVTAQLSLALAIFNLLPVSPLDGSKVLFAFLSDQAYEKLMRYERYGMIVLIALSLSGVLGGPLSAAVEWCYLRLWPLAEWGASLGAALF